MPTIPFKTKIVIITNGSIHAGSALSSYYPKIEAIYETTAAPNKIFTNISSNYSLILSQIESFSSSGS